MRSSYAALALLMGGAFAIPVAEPQDLPMSDYDAIPTAIDIAAPFGDPGVTSTVVYVASAAATSAVISISEAIATETTSTAATATVAARGAIVVGRSLCTPESAGNGPSVNAPDDTPASFLAHQEFSTRAQGAATPQGYVLAPQYKNLQQAVSNPTYLTYTTDGITSYDPQVCADKCDTISGCVSFNIYFERDPSYVPDDINCPNPESLTRIKCSFFGTMITIADAGNAGQYQSQFQIVIAGSNTYNKPPKSINGFSGPTFLDNAAIMSPLADNSYMRVQTFPQTQPYDPSVCAAACTEATAYANRHGTGRFCNFFDAYILYKNGQNGVFTCTYYTQPYPGLTFARNHGQYNSKGDHYTIASSYTYQVN